MTVTVPRDCEQPVHRLDPQIEIFGAEAVGAGFQHHRRGRRLALLEIGRVGKGMGHGSRRRKERRAPVQGFLDIRMDDPDAGAAGIAAGILLGEHGIAGGDLDAGDMNAGHPIGQAKGGNTCPHARFEDRVVGGARDAGGQENRVDSRPGSLFQAAGRANGR